MKETILAKIQNEHHELLGLLEKVESSQDYFRRLELFNKVKSLLVDHMVDEEQSIYTKFRNDVKEPQTEKLVQSSDREHHQIKEYLQRLNLINFGRKNWLDMFKLFKETIKKHCEDEKKRILAEAKEDFSKEELLKIAGEFEEAKH